MSIGLYFKYIYTFSLLANHRFHSGSIPKIYEILEILYNTDKFIYVVEMYVIKCTYFSIGNTLGETKCLEYSIVI